MFRRDLLAGAAAGATAAVLPRFAVAQPAAQRVLKYVPHANIPNIDPFTNTAFIARDHAFLVYDQLYGMNDKFEPVPQMVQGHVVENDGLLWRFTLREGLKFHDGSAVRGRDCIASIKRWGRRDAFGQELIARVADMTEDSDRVFTIKLSRPFPKIIEAFSKVTTSCLFIMPERLANVDPFTNITEAVGSGPFRFVHPGAATGEDTLVHALLAHCAGSLSGIGGVERPGIVHRLDKETTGVIVVAKTDKAHRALADQFATRTLTKEYVALVAGVPQLLSGTIDRAIARHPIHRHRMTVGEGGRPARTDWERVEAFGEIAALLRCRIFTGRTHQIRAHLKSLGHPILGDPLYGWKADARLAKQPERVMLHAERLVLTHPISGKELELRAPLPKDFEVQILQLRKVARAEAKTKGTRTKPAKSGRRVERLPFHEHEPRK